MLCAEVKLGTLAAFQNAPDFVGYVVVFTVRKTGQSFAALLTAETTSSVKKISWSPSITLK